MKRTILPILLLIVVTSCTKSKELSGTARHQPSQSISSTQSKKLESCNFGQSVFNLSRRAPIVEEFAGARKPRRGTENITVSSALIYIDMDGQLVENSVWNLNGALNLMPANLYLTEVDKIVQRVSEDYAPFNVVVTTNEAEYLAANPMRRMRVVVTESWEWYGQVGGIAYYDSFTWGDNTPCFVFSSLLNYNEKFIAEAISHEVGHTLGLRHQATYANGCTFISEYNEGTGSGETSWAPIMGNSYYRNVTTWNRGAVATSCSMVQDDVSILTGVLGLKQDLNNELSKSTTLNTSVDGVISSETDIDFYFVVLEKTSVIDLQPLSLGNGTGANLHLKISLYDKAGKFVQEISNPSSLSVSTSLPKGRYYIGVETVANSNQGRYGMLGRYILKAI